MAFLRARFGPHYDTRTATPDIDKDTKMTTADLGGNVTPALPESDHRAKVGARPRAEQGKDRGQTIYLIEEEIDETYNDTLPSPRSKRPKALVEATCV